MSRLMESPTLLHLYNDIISDQRVHRETATKTCPLPLSSPRQKNVVTTFMWIVFDSSCQQEKRLASLNDCLLVGPPFMNDLCSILLRFRIPTFAFATDTEKTFLHMKLHNSDNNSDMDYSGSLTLPIQLVTWQHTVVVVL